MIKKVVSCTYLSDFSADNDKSDKEQIRLMIIEATRLMFFENVFLERVILKGSNEE